MSNRRFLVLLGGFLGAGKTTLILTASRLLSARGLRTAAILNDQGAHLVDTELVKRNGFAADQVTGGCFCCRFSDLIDAAQRLNDFHPDVIFAEAVGSCTDISATTLQPLRLYYRQEYELAPYTVLVDGIRAEECFSQPDSDLAFLFHKQLAEADLVAFTRTDLYSSFPCIPDCPVRYMSPLTGEGVTAWLDEVLDAKLPFGSKVLEIDYERYARAEASLAWLNCKARVTLETAQTPASVVGPLLERLDEFFSDSNIRLAHLKLMSDCAAGYVKASVISNGATPSIEGILHASAEREHELLLNVRAIADPSVLQRLVEQELVALPGAVIISNMQCFRPSPPRPQHRLDLVTS
ncbi:MAG: GTP-binding protein [Bryobacteraceae bacterium]